MASQKRELLIVSIGMEWLYPITLRVIAAVVLIYFGLGLFNVNWLLRVRILVALTTGALIVAAAGYPLVRPADPLGAISVFTGEISIVSAAILVGLGLVGGIVGTLLCQPLGGALGPFAAPAGVATLAVTSGGLRQLLLTHHALDQRNALYGVLRWELLFWLGICAAGYLGSYLTSKLIANKADAGQTPKIENKSNYWTHCVIAAVAAAVIVYFTIGIFAQDIRQIDENLGFVVGHPGSRQIAFGVFVSVGLAGFVAKQFLQVHFIPVVVGAAAVYIGTLSKFIGSDTLAYMVKTWPIDFFPNSIYAILPIQFAPFAILGAMTGYWTSIYLKRRPEHPE
ncbi:MAG: hypothetical protein H8D61_01725 [Deltaproteobacteria bacterium]|nr:hypothetical protein [Deltaproteobacteria bacterium]